MSSREGEGKGEEKDPRESEVPHDPSWELEPRWSEADRALLEAARAKLQKGPGLERPGLERPGLAVVRPSEEESDKKTG